MCFKYLYFCIKPLSRSQQDFQKNTKPCKIFQEIKHFQDIHNFSAHQAVSLECCSSSVDSAVLWSEMFCVRLKNHPALSESNTRVKNPLKTGMFRFFWSKTHWTATFLTKTKRSWKSVFTLPSAHQKLIFSVLFQDLALAVRPKWWFLIFWKKWNHTAWDSPKHRFFQKFANFHFFQLFWSVS